MSLRSIGLSTICILAAMGFAVRADAPAVRLIRDGGIQRIDPINEQFRTVWRWSNGAYFFADRPAGFPPTFYTVGQDGTLINSAHFEYSDGDVFYHGPADRMSNGTFVFAGMTERTYRNVSPFLAWISVDGKVQHLQRMGKYLICFLAVAPDDTIWTLGYEADTSEPKWKINKDANVLRHFDSSGSLLKSVYSLAEFNRFHGWKNIPPGLFAAASDKIGWYSSLEGRAIYLEILLNDFSVRTYPGAGEHVDKFDTPVRLAITGAGVASVMIQDRSPDHRTNYILNPSSEKWTAIEVPHLGGLSYAPILIGSDKQDLVYFSGHESAFFNIQKYSSR